MAGVILPNMIIVRKGDSFDIVLQFRTDDKPWNLTDCTVKMTVRNNEEKVLFSKSGEIFDVSGGKVRLKLLPADTNITPGDYKTDIQIKLKTGDIHTVYPGDVNKVAVFRITPEVTE